MFAGRSFSTRLIAAVTLVAAAIIAGGLYGDYRLARARILEELALNARSAIESATARIGEMTTGVESTVRAVSETLVDVPTDDVTDRILESLITSNPHIAASALALHPEAASRADGYAPYRFRRPGRKGSSLGRADLADAVTPYWEEDWFSLPQTTGDARWVEPYFEATGVGAPTITFAAPFYASPDVFLGVVTADLTLDTLEPYLEDLALDSAGFGFLLSSRGTLIGAPTDEVIGQAIGSVFPGVPSLAPDAWLRSARTPGFVEVIPCPRRDESCSLRLRPMGEGAWFVGIVYSEERLLRPLRSYAVRTLAIGLTMLGAMALLTGLITRRLTRPLIGLAEASGAIARGDLDVPLPAASGSDEVATLVQAFDSMREELGGYIDEVTRNAAQRSRLEGEMAAAAEIQRAMLPQGGRAELRTKDLELWAHLKPARAVGGDLYSFVLDDNQLLFAIGDVSDKGVAAALFMARAIALIGQWEAQKATVPPQVTLHQINNSLSQDNERCMFLTLTLGILNLESRTLRFASAGHSAPLLLRDASVTEITQERGPPLALMDDLEFPINEMTLLADDRIVFYTDGFDEARNPDGDALGLAAFQGLVLSGSELPSGEAGARLFEAIEAYARGRAQHDDMTLLVLEIPGARRVALQSDYRAFALDDSLVADTFAWFEDHWRSQGCDEERLGELRLVLEELVCNVRNHSGLDAQDKLTLGLDRYGDRIELTCEDTGKAFDPLSADSGAELGRDTQDAEIGGLGIHLIRRLTDEQSYRRENGRNILRLRLWLAARDTADKPAEPAPATEEEP